MKKTIFFGLGALLALGVTSCSKDEIAINVAKPLEADQTFYTNIRVCSNDDATRADTNEQFDKGEDYENEVNSVYFIFYDKDGQRVATSQVMKVNGKLEGFDKGTPTTGPKEPWSENSVYEGVVQVEVKQGMQIPAYVMCFVNPITKTNFDINPDFATLDALKRARRESIIDGDNTFAMSKSVYYGPDRSNPNWKESDRDKIVATPLNVVRDNEGNIDETDAANQLFTSREQAENALAKDDSLSEDGYYRTTSSVVDIYVERYAAKVGLEIDANASKPLTAINPKGEGTEISVEFVPQHWCVNAYETETYACKSFLSDGLVKDLYYEEVCEALGTDGDVNKAWNWNNPQLHRSYWAQSPAYYEKSYPRNADDINDSNMGFAINGSKYALGYYSYDEIIGNAKGQIADKARSVEETGFPYIYVRENTVQGDALRKAAEDPLASAKAAIGSVVIVGKYKITNAGQGRSIDGEGFLQDETLYMMGNKTNGYRAFIGENDMKDYFINTSIMMAKDDKGTPFFKYDNKDYKFEDADADAYRKLFTVSHPRIDVRCKLDMESMSKLQEYMVMDSRFVTLQISEDEIEKAGHAPIYVWLDNKWQEVTIYNLAEVNRQIMYSCGTVQGYKDGLAFFSIPIKHLGSTYRPDNPNKNYNPGDSQFKWEKVRTGDFGIVRNHSYSIHVTQIAGLGNGIPNTTDPIVPPTDPEEYYIGARLIILNWAVVPRQDVKL